jgi:PAS domain S-box-containing protein
MLISRWRDDPQHDNSPELGAVAASIMSNDMDLSIDLESFIRAAGDAIIAVGNDGGILLWNPAAERIFGFTAKDAIGQSLDLIIPERYRERHWNGFRQVMLSGHSRYGTEVLRVPALHKDGRALSIAFTVALVNSPGSESQAIVAIVRDETQRWNEERELRRRIAELERPT